MKIKPLTDKEKTFAQLFVENMFSNDTRTNTDIAIAAGYAKESAHQRAYEQTLKDLDYHATVFDLMKMGKDSVMVIHGGGVYKDKEGTLQRWCENYRKLSEKIKDRLVLENCEKSYSIIEVAKMFKSKIKYLPRRPGERYASALTKMNLTNKIYKYYGKILLKDYIGNFVNKKKHLLK